MDGVNDIKDFLTYFEQYSGGVNTNKVTDVPKSTIIEATPAVVDSNIETIAVMEDVAAVNIPNADSVLEKVVIPSPAKVAKPDNNFYKIFRDKSEDFNCEISVEGATIDNTTVRLLFITEEWNVFIDGTIDNNGNVSIPIKKMSLFKEGTCGTVKMEVVADNTVFVPWETEFEVKESKKVLVTFNENKQIKESKSVNVTLK